MFCASKLNNYNLLIKISFNKNNFSYNVCVNMIHDYKTCIVIFIIFFLPYQIYKQEILERNIVNVRYVSLLAARDPSIAMLQSSFVRFVFPMINSAPSSPASSMCPRAMISMVILNQSRLNTQACLPQRAPFPCEITHECAT